MSRCVIDVRDRADITLEPLAGDITALRWHTTFHPVRTGTGRLYRWARGRANRASVAGLRRAAEQTGASCGS